MDVLGDIVTFIVNLINYVWLVLYVIWLSFGINPEVIELVKAHPESLWVTAGVAVVAGASTLVGQSIILFLNRVRPTQFMLSLLLNGILFLISLTVWIVITYGVAVLLIEKDPPFLEVMRVLLLSTAPLAFSFLTLIPYAGGFIGRALAVWSLVYATYLVDREFEADFLMAAACVGLGWLLMQVLSSTIGRPVVALRNRVWQRLVGTRLDADLDEIITAMAVEDPKQVIQRLQTEATQLEPVTDREQDD